MRTVAQGSAAEPIRRGKLEAAKGGDQHPQDRHAEKADRKLLSDRHLAQG